MESEVCSRGHHLCRSPWPDTCLPARPLLPPSLLAGTESFVYLRMSVCLTLILTLLFFCVGVSSYSVNVKEHALRHNGSDLLVVQPHFFLSFCSLTSHFSSVRHPVITSFHVFCFCMLKNSLGKQTSPQENLWSIATHYHHITFFFF